MNREAYENYTGDFNHYSGSKTLASQTFSISGTSVYILYAAWIGLQTNPRGKPLQTVLINGCLLLH